MDTKIVEKLNSVLQKSKARRTNTKGLAADYENILILDQNHNFLGNLYKTEESLSDGVRTRQITLGLF